MRKSSLKTLGKCVKTGEKSRKNVWKDTEMPKNMLYVVEVKANDNSTISLNYQIDSDKYILSMGLNYVIKTSALMVNFILSLISWLSY